MAEERKEHPLEKYMDKWERDLYRRYLDKRDIMRATAILRRAYLRKIGRGLLPVSVEKELKK